MNDRVVKLAAEDALVWSGVSVPNPAAAEMAAQLATVIASFEALRGTLQFEDEPSSFEAALLETKE